MGAGLPAVPGDSQRQLRLNAKNPGKPRHAGFFYARQGHWKIKQTKKKPLGEGLENTARQQLPVKALAFDDASNVILCNL